MYFLAFVFALALAVWSAIAVLYGSVQLTALIFLIATICFPAEFFAIDMGGLTITVDRLLLIPLAIQVSIAWYRGDQRLRQLEYTDIAIGIFATWLVLRTITQPLGSVLPGQPNTLMHLINGYLVPFALYLAVRTAKIDKDQMKWVLGAVLLLGLYLGITAFFEVANMWELVFPRFIGDPDLGIHFGRARGPMLQSVRLGICLIFCWICLALFTVWLKPLSRPHWVMFSFGTGILFLAVFLTYTRSVWLGLAFSMLLLALMGLQGFPRRVVVFAMLSGVLFVGAYKGSDLIAFKREYSAAETKESTYMRAAFAYVSFAMFRDKPIAGFGFNQFQVYNPPYLDDRNTKLNLNSIRGYVHHNGFLSLLVDLGMIGFGAYCLVLLSVTSQALSLWRAAAVPQWIRAFALLSLSYLGVHSIQMLFHEMSFSTIENGLLFATLGVMVAAKQQFCVRKSRRSAESSRPISSHSLSHA